ncbi:MAG: hypothetical protein JST65_18840 [Acidobacteria bacterium]|nr:hypothetical protein [Acidobacteriota bacterium]
MSTFTAARVVEDRGASDDGTIDVAVLALRDILESPPAPLGATFVKPDLQGYELRALEGAGAALADLDVFPTEASFYAHDYETSIARLIAFFDRHRFELHDIGSLSPRRRDCRAHQTDLLFVRRESRFTRDRAWD